MKLTGTRYSAVYLFKKTYRLASIKKLISEIPVEQSMFSKIASAAIALCVIVKASQQEEKTETTEESPVDEQVLEI